MLRSNILVDGIESNTQAGMRSFPELIDIGIMGHCHAAKSGICQRAGIDCYQSALSYRRPNMPLSDYKQLLAQCKGKTFQVALGGTGDPNKHENFFELLQFTRELGIVPNLTTSGYMLEKDEIQLIKQYCGAVAVSFYSRLDTSMNETNEDTILAINSLIDAGCKVNVHYVLSTDTLEEAIIRIRHNLFPKGINAVVFLLYKPVGSGKQTRVIDGCNKIYSNFLKHIHSANVEFKIGFDTCQSPGLLRYNRELSLETIDVCEAARFSMYIDCDLMAFPCSFGRENAEYSVNLREMSISDAWDSKAFERFRTKQENMCNACEVNGCIGCALSIDLNTCGLWKQKG